MTATILLRLAAATGTLVLIVALVIFAGWYAVAGGQP